MKKYLILFIVTLFSTVLMAQAVNKGQFYIKPGSTVSILYSFENKGEGDFRNNGVLYLYDNLISNGKFFDFKGNVPQGKTIFRGKKLQTISGNSLIHLNNLELDNSKQQKAFDLFAPIAIQGNTQFNNGILFVNPIGGSISFMNNATTETTNDKSHIEGQMEKEGNKNFQFPQGDGGFYRPAQIFGAPKTKDVVVSEYTFKDDAFFKSHINKSGVIVSIDTNEYWKVEQNTKATSSFVLTLSWDERTTSKAILEANPKDIRIVRWDAKAQLWVDEGGVVDESMKTVTTPTELKGYGFFTLGLVKSDTLLEGDVVIYNYVNVNGADQNDFFRIDNITRFPNNKVEIFNRWGVKVYETTNYNSQGNVFRGYSEGRVTVNKNEKLPSGTYYYILTYEHTSKNGANLIKKAGYIHLDSNE